MHKVFFTLHINLIIHKNYASESFGMNYILEIISYRNCQNILKKMYRVNKINEHKKGITNNIQIL